MKAIGWRKLLLTTLVFGYIIAGCSADKEVDEPDNQQDVELSATPLILDFEAVGGSKSISISSNVVWRINFVPSGWCVPNIQVSSGSATVNISVQTNQSETARTASMTITAQGAETITLTINQKGATIIDPDPNPGEEEYIEPDNNGMRPLTSGDFSKLMKLGWNLGNSLEAIIVNNGNYSGGETSWGNPVTTKILIDAVKAAGFNTIRIPVSWSHKLINQSTFQISQQWKERVEEVVNYAMDNDMFVIINLHWDGGWLDQPIYSKQTELNTKLAALWKQIAIHFRNYDDRLLFAGTNEVHVEGNYNAPTNENLAVQNSFNQTFVNTVRATGGRNAYRHLVVQGYNTNIEFTYNSFVMPTDNVENKLMVEVHYYDPYDFTLMESGAIKTEWGAAFSGGNVSNWGQEAWVNTTFEKMKSKFVNNGVPVILGEYGAMLRATLTGDALTRHITARNNYLEFVTNAAMQNGMVPIYWDNGFYGDKGFALFNRSTGAIEDNGALQAIINGGTK